MSIKKFFSNSFFTSVVDFVYPPYCLSCEQITEESSKLLCLRCEEALELADSSLRCPRCFSAEKTSANSCGVCRKRTLNFYRAASAFDYVGPAAALVKKLKFENLPALAEGLAAFLAAQLVKLKWPFPDVIIPVPISFVHKIDRGYNQSLLLAKALGIIIERPVYDVLKKSNSGYSQTGRSRSQRMDLGEKSFKLKSVENLRDKKILIVDDVMTTMTTLNRCAEALFEAHPKTIYGLTVCRA